jgi:hypothetical protein
VSIAALHKPVMDESDNDVAGGGVQKNKKKLSTTERGQQPGLRAQQQEAAEGSSSGEGEEQGREGAQGGVREQGMEKRKKQRVGPRQSCRLDNVKARQTAQVRSFLSFASEKATKCEKMRDWMIVAVLDDGAILSQSSRLFDEYCYVNSGLSELVRNLSNQGTDEQKEAKQDILNVFGKGLKSAWTNMGRSQAIALVSGLGVGPQMKRGYESDDVPDHMRRFLDDEHYIDLGCKLEENMGGRLGARAGDRKVEPGKLLSMDSWVAGVPPSSEEDPGRYKLFSDIVLCKDHTKMSHAELCALVGITLEWLDPGARVWVCMCAL